MFLPELMTSRPLKRVWENEHNVLAIVTPLAIVAVVGAGQTYALAGAILVAAAIFISSNRRYDNLDRSSFNFGNDIIAAIMHRRYVYI